MSRSASLFRRLSMGLVFLFLYAPILVLIVFSFNDSNSRSVWAANVNSKTRISLKNFLQH